MIGLALALIDGNASLSLRVSIGEKDCSLLTEDGRERDDEGEEEY